MRTVALVFFLVALGAQHCLSAPTAINKLPGTCPTANPKPTGCYCTNGCGVNGEPGNPDGFYYKPSVWPPRAESAKYVGADTICARITIPTRPTILGRALTAWLAIGGDIFNNGTMFPGPADNEQVTIYTAFTQHQCKQFNALANAAYLNDVGDAPSHLFNLQVTLCTTTNCNGPKAFVPTPSKSIVTAAAKFPGACPVSNKAKTGCYCTSDCSWNAEVDGFEWTSAVWPPISYPPSYVGADTICATITIPVVSSLTQATDLAAALGITGDIHRTGELVTAVPNGSEVTIYTAFTQAQCAEFMTKAQALATALPASKNLGIFMCNVTNCNTVGAYQVVRNV